MSESQSFRAMLPYRLLIIALVGSIALTMIIGATWMVIDPEDDLCGQQLSSSALLVLCFGTLLTADTVRRRKRFPLTMTISMIATVLGVAYFEALIWFEQHVIYPDYEDTLPKLAGTLLIFGVGLAHNGAFSLIVTKSRVLLAMKIAVMCCVWAMGLAVLAIFWMESWVNHFGGGWMGGFFFLIGVAVFLGLGVIAGTIAVPIAAISRANKEIVRLESIQSRLALLLACPTCALRQELRAGLARCAGCGTGLFIEVEEPRCECGYLLYQLQGDTCPECGRPVQTPRRQNAETLK